MDRICIPLGNGDWIALTAEELAAHKAEAVALGFGPPATIRAATTEPLITAEELAEALRVPLSRIGQGTRDGTIPSVKMGRYYRYYLSAVEKKLSK